MSILPPLLQFDYTNWKGEEHLYLIEVEGISLDYARDRSGGKSILKHWHLNGKCIRRDGDRREDQPRRSFVMTKMRNVIEVVR